MTAAQWYLQGEATVFESAELGHRIDKDTWRREVPRLRSALLDAQFELGQRREFPVVVLVSGQDGGGKGETINELYAWMDPRFMSTLAFSAPTDEERARPPMWRYWRALPPKGRIGIFAGSWYSDPIHDAIEARMGRFALDQRVGQINRFEAMLVNEGALVLKFWFHLTKEAQKKRLKALQNNPKTAWRVTRWNWKRLKTYDKLVRVAGHVLRLTNTPWAPWTIVEGADDRYRSLTVGNVILESLRQKLAGKTRAVTPAVPSPPPRVDGRDVLTELDLACRIDKKDYVARLAR